MVITFSRSVSICDGGCKAWAFSELKTIGSTEYIALKASDGSFCRLVQNQHVAARSQSRLQGNASALLSKWQALRTIATLEHVATKSASFSTLFDDPLPTERHKKRARKEAAKQELPNHLDVTLPGCTNADGT